MVAVGVGVGVPLPSGAWISTVMGDPILKKPGVALAVCRGWSASNRKLYSVPQRFMRANVGLSKTGRSRIRRRVQVIDVHAEANLQKFGDVLLDLGWDAVRYPIHTACSLARALF